MILYSTVGDSRAAERSRRLFLAVRCRLPSLSLLDDAHVSDGLRGDVLDYLEAI
jgi:hypothetical protein